MQLKSKKTGEKHIKTMELIPSFICKLKQLALIKPFIVLAILTLASSFAANAQNVGIGNTSPDEKLHVTGKVKIEHALVVKPVNKTAAATIAITSNDGFVVIYHANGTQANAISMTGTPTDGQMLTIRNGDVYDDATFSGTTISAGTTMQFTYTNSNWKQVGSPSGATIITAIADADNDTKIQVEETADEDVIHFDLGGTEMWKMIGNRLEPVNNGSSIFIGIESGFKDQKGHGNTGIGHNTLVENISEYNTALGAFALRYNTVGDSNTANGFGALANNTTGSNNSAFGSLALVLNSKGHNNSAFGESAMFYNHGDNNSSFGYLSSYKTTYGDNNSSFGSHAMYSNITGSRNTVFGTSALFKNTTGSNNAAHGYMAMFSNTTGLNNTAIGYEALYSNKTGSYNVALGNQAGYYETGSNKLYIANSFDTTPLIYGEFDNDLLRVNGTLNINDEFSFPTADGTSGQVLATNGSGTLSWTTLSSPTDNQTVDVFSLSGSTLSISLEDDGASDYKVDLSSIDTDTDNQTVDIFSLSGSTLSISLEDDGASTNTLDLSSINTDNQTVDVFSLSGTTLSISLEDDAPSNYTVDLSSINSTKTLIADADADTKIQVEESADEDLIRFDLGGTQKWLMTGSRLEPSNTGNSTFIGFESGLNDDLSSNSNTAIGNRTLYSNTTGSNNLANGSLALFTNTTGALNVANGGAAMYKNTYGSENVALGYATLFNNTSGNRNVAIGYEAGFYETGSDKLYISNSNTTTPLIYGDFNSDLLVINGFLRPALDDKYTLGNSSLRWKALYATNGTIQTSDVRFKKNITNINYGLNDLMKLRSVTYQWKEDSLGETKLGFIAQELEQIVPEVVTIANDSMQTRGVNYAELIPVLVKAIQEQQAIIEAQKAQAVAQQNDLEKYKVQTNTQEERLASLEAKLNILLGTLTATK